ncbi:hypothetical protein [Runella limosa]|uniref:hypothetical protein n=1 Tax=Runella limosa TaxID=370978 RepID=UPI0004210634|nr:hypothetical protein [Runella limosa]
MNPNFKLRFDQMKESSPADTASEKEMGVASNEYTLARPLNLCLVWPDGKRFFLNYSYLIAGEFNPEGETNRIQLYFTTYQVSLKGYGLEALFMALLEQLPHQLIAIEPRYVVSEEAPDGTVIEITVEKTGE